jgi:hypothetical protein
MTCHQTIVWIDAHKAYILRVADGLEQESTISASSTATATQEATVGTASETAPHGYFHRVARALDIADEILIVGPSGTKAEFASYMHKNDHAIDPRILGVETIAHPRDDQLAAFAKLYFAHDGRRQPKN